jgi:riboflavin-specific deaminase-like protein
MFEARLLRDPAQRPSPCIDDGEWHAVLAAARNPAALLPQRWESLFGPLIRMDQGETCVVGQLGQSLDGRIATVSGHSKYINGSGCLSHLHRLRAICDVVVVGAGTAIADDPQLNVRLVEGPNPARAIIDPNGRVPRGLRLFEDDGVRRIVITAADTQGDWPEGVEVLRMNRLACGGLCPSAIVQALANAGLRRILIEGGSQTISRFIAARALDRLHLLIAPMIIGAGKMGLELSPIQTLQEALRPRMIPHQAGDEVLLDCDLRSCAVYS